MRILFMGVCILAGLGVFLPLLRLIFEDMGHKTFIKKSHVEKRYSDSQRAGQGTTLSEKDLENFDTLLKNHIPENENIVILGPANSGSKQAVVCANIVQLSNETTDVVPSGYVRLNGELVKIDECQ